jgi:hypothetical protein
MTQSSAVEVDADLAAHSADRFVEAGQQVAHQRRLQVGVVRGQALEISDREDQTLAVALAANTDRRSGTPASATSPKASPGVKVASRRVEVGEWACAFSKSGEILCLRYLGESQDEVNFRFAATGWRQPS